MSAMRFSNFFLFPAPAAAPQPAGSLPLSAARVARVEEDSKTPIATAPRELPGDLDQRVREVGEW